MISSALTNKGRVTIPREIRRQLGLQAGDRVGFLLENNHVILVRKINDVEAAFGICKAKRSASLKDIKAAVCTG